MWFYVIVTNTVESLCWWALVCSGIRLLSSCTLHHIGAVDINAILYISFACLGSTLLLKGSITSLRSEETVGLQVYIL